jgi:hypothetical protein
MFEKVKTKVYVVGCNHIVAVTVVTVTAIGFSAGTFVGVRAASPTRITHMMTMALTTSCLFKSVPLDLCSDVGYNPEPLPIPTCLPHMALTVGHTTYCEDRALTFPVRV